MVLFQLPSALYMRTELAKTKEQLAEDKKIALAVRVKPLNIESLTVAELRQKAQSLWDAIVRLESEKYDLEERKKRQEYDVSVDYSIKLWWISVILSKILFYLNKITTVTYCSTHQDCVFSI